MHFRRHIGPIPDIKLMDMAPFMGILLLLLIFFMLQSSFIMYPGIKVNLPRALTGEAVKSIILEVAVSSGGNAIYANGRTVSVQELEAMLKQAAEMKGSVLIKADKSTSLGRIVEIWDMCRNSGVAQINIAANHE